MRLATFKLKSIQGETIRSTIQVDEKRFVDINSIWQLYFKKEKKFNYLERAIYHCPAVLSEILKLKSEPLKFLQESYELFLKYNKQGEEFNLINPSLNDKNGSIKWLAPLDKINLYRDFYTHEKHVKKGFEKRNEEMPKEWYNLPVYYKGATASFIGHNEEVLWPSFTDKLDYELELGAVIAKDGINIKARDAYKHILGFTILNDISARDMQKKEMSVRLGPSKGKDFCSVMGPVIVTMDEFNFKEPSLAMSAKVNGKEWSKGISSDAYFTFAQMIEFASKDEWVVASDFIGSGTVGTGCGLELDKWIKSGDVIELNIEKIGILKNIIGKKVNGKF